MTRQFIMACLTLASLTTAAASVPVDNPKTYLASIEGVQLKSGESIDKIEINSWGVVFKAVCHIPEDWEVTAGSFGPGGKLMGEAGHGASQVRSKDEYVLRDIVLVELVGPVQKRDIRDNTGIVPATFSGFAQVQSGWSDGSRRAPITYSNVRLTPANNCPVVRGKSWLSNPQLSPKRKGAPRGTPSD
jgi:hypothetical protein